MPVLGYLGFPPFAVECAVMYNFLVMVEDRWLTPRAQQRCWLGQLLFWVIMFAALDRWTVLAIAAGRNMNFKSFFVILNEAKISRGSAE